MNQPPRILEPEGEPGDEHLIVLPTDFPVVVAVDPDGDDLLFDWIVPGYGDLQPTTSQDEGGNWLSLVRLPQDPELNDRLVRVLVIDESPAHNSQTVLFRVEVP